MQILGISAYYHDSAAAIVSDGEMVAAAQEERFSRQKHDAGFPKGAIAYCLKEAGTKLQNVDQIVLRLMYAANQLFVRQKMLIDAL